MATESSSGRAHRRAQLAAGGVVAATALLAGAPAASAHAHVHSRAHRPHWTGPDAHRLQPDSLVISGTVFPRDGVDLSVGQDLPYANNYSASADPEPTSDPGFVQAVADGQYPYVFNNASVDGSFGVASPIDLWNVSLWGQPLGRIRVPSAQMSTSFSSKSELALNVSTDGQDLSWLGYGGPVGGFDESNANTPGVFDPTNPDVAGENSTLTAGGVYRVAGTLSSRGQWTFTDTNAYSGDNGRAALLENSDGKDFFFAAGNDNNGYTGKKDYPTVPADLIDATGAQVFSQSFLPQNEQAPAAPTELATFSIAQLGDAADKAGKDTNFRGLTEFDNVVYYTKGSGSNGVNTVYFVDTTGKACPKGVGLPEAGAALPTPGTSYQLCILKGFPTALASGATDASDYPFGIWFANRDTLYVADEGSGDNTYDATTNTYTADGASTTAGLQKWVYNQKAQQWELAYVVQNGLDLGTPYVVPGYPTGDNTETGGTDLPWAPATDGLRNISGHVNRDGTVTIYATTSTVSGSGDEGADPNKVVAVTDRLGEDTLPAGEKFVSIRPGAFGVRYGGVAVLSSDFGTEHRRGSGW
jgi:hypothetical protein